MPVHYQSRSPWVGPSQKLKSRDCIRSSEHSCHICRQIVNQVGPQSGSDCECPYSDIHSLSLPCVCLSFLQTGTGLMNRHSEQDVIANLTSSFVVEGACFYEVGHPCASISLVFGLASCYCQLWHISMVLALSLSSLFPTTSAVL